MFPGLIGDPSLIGAHGQRQESKDDCKDDTDQRRHHDISRTAFAFQHSLEPASRPWVLHLMVEICQSLGEVHVADPLFSRISQ